MQELKTQLKFLFIYCIIITMVIIALIAYIIVPKSGNFEQLTTKRINIIEKDGKIRMVLSDKELQHPGRMDNKNLPKRERTAGLLFFNDLGDECGGIGYDGDKTGADMFITMDQYKNDQILVLSYAQNGGKPFKSRSYGLTLNDRDDYSFAQAVSYFDSLKKLNDTAAYKSGLQKFKAAGHLDQRMFLGKNENGEVGLFLADAKGKTRLKIYINKDNKPVYQTLDENGKIVFAK